MHSYQVAFENIDENLSLSEEIQILSLSDTCF